VFATRWIIKWATLLGDHIGGSPAADFSLERKKTVTGSPDYARRADFVLMIAMLVVAGVALLAVFG
jgi:hypothetical protein